MDKLISQQAAIEALCKSECNLNNAECRHKDDTDFCVTCDNVKIINSLPSAQPDLDEWCTDCKEYDPDKHCCPRFSRVIREALKEAQPERKTAKWIPVTERLPEIDEGVLVSDGEWVWKDWLEVSYGKVGWYNNETLEGTAWMPLPEPYQRGEQ